MIDDKFDGVLNNSINAEEIGMKIEDTEYVFDYSFEYKNCNHKVFVSNDNDKTNVVIVVRNGMTNLYTINALPSVIRNKINYYNELFRKLKIGDE